MDEDIAIIDSNTRKEKVKNFFLKNKIILISLVSLIILSLVIYFGYGEYSKKKKIEITTPCENAPLSENRIPSRGWVL